MALENIEDWAARARAAASRATEGFEERMGYVPDVQEIRTSAADADLRPRRLPDQVRRFFDEIDEIFWPDIWNGYFIGPSRDIIRRYRDRDPCWVLRDPEMHTCIVVGSDGGGAHFAVDLDENGVVLRVAGATVQEGTLRGDVEVIAPDFDAFLERLIDNADMVSRGREPSF